MNKFKELEKLWNQWKAKNRKHEAKPGSAENKKAALRAGWNRWNRGFFARMIEEMPKRNMKSLSQKRRV
jgi:hypothetical protein